MKRKLIAIAVTTMLGVSNGANAATAVLSLNPYAAFVDDGALIELTGFNGPIRLPGNDGTPNISFGFTIPHDYVVDSTLKVVLLWESSAQDCTFNLRPNFLYRAGNGKPLDGGNASGGLEALSASTTFVLTGTGISMDASNPAGTTERVTFTIKPTPGEFDTLSRGRAVNFGIFREDRDAVNDSCAGDLRISGVSIVYQTP